ncbi:MAG: class I SAM-dependent methyltransferase [Defluviitaleaceae bacterium]|nr:class I SAM-dependent methyltransferase [Defluviitaleaceae bacterium]
MKIFLCPKCGKAPEGFPPKQCGCVYEVPVINGVYQFTEDAPFVTESEGLKWLGYENIGENYEPGYFYNKDADVIGNSFNLASFMGSGKTVLDIGAGLGASAVSFALAGLKIIAADISQVMLESAVKRAERHGVPTDSIIFARMNGYKLAMADNSADAVLEVDMLHQVDQPELIMDEILRVLKPDGYFLQYGAWSGASFTEEQQAVNVIYNNAQTDIQDYYSKTLDEAGFSGPLFSTWERVDAYKREKFTLHTTLSDTGCYDVKNAVWTLNMGLHKTRTRAAGAKQLIPEGMHEAVWAKTDAYAKEKYGEDYLNIKRYMNNRSGILVYKVR